MTDTEIVLAVLLLFSFLFIVYLSIEMNNKSHSGAPQPSPLPAPPKTKEGPWFLHVEFLESANRYDVYAKADNITGLCANPKTHELHVDIAYKHREVFKDVERYSFVPASQMGEWLFEEE